MTTLLSPLSLFRGMLLGSFVAVAAACGGEGLEVEATDAEAQDPTTASVQEPIINGTKATGYAESVLVDMYKAGSSTAWVCSGSLIAPRVVLTAGHCVKGYSSWKVTLPYAGKQTAFTSRAATNYSASGEAVNAAAHDVGLIFLDKPMTLPTAFPTLQSTKLANGTRAVNVGRINNGQVSSTDLFVSQQVYLKDGAAVGFPYSYSSAEVIQPGDSGGATVLAGSSPRRIVAVNSGSGSGYQVLARVDLVLDWIKSNVNQNGGFYGAPTQTSTTTTTTCSVEAEPNGSGQPQPISTGSVCGQLNFSGDEDWFSWNSTSSGLAYSLELQGTEAAQAELLVWKMVDGVYTQIPNQTPQRVAATTTGPGYYVAVVWSPTGAIPSYKLVSSLK